MVFVETLSKADLWDSFPFWSVSIILPLTSKINIEAIRQNQYLVVYKRIFNKKSKLAQLSTREAFLEANPVIFRNSLFRIIDAQDKKMHLVHVWNFHTSL